MAVLTAFSLVDMTDWSFDNINTGTVTTTTSLKYAIAGGDGEFFYEFGGVGLTYNGSDELTGGIVTSYRVFDADGNLLLSVSGMNVGANKVQNAINNDDSNGVFEINAFAHANTMNGSDGSDVLQAFSQASETLYGGDGDDIIIDFSLSIESTDSIFGGAGDDVVLAGAHWEDHNVDGGDGYDTIVFDGNYPVSLILNPVLTGVEQLILLGGPQYNLILLGDDMVGAGAALRVDGSALGSGTQLNFDGEGELDGHFELIGGGGNDNLRGGALTDTFWLDGAGRDHAAGGGDDDTFHFGSRFAADDRVRGGFGFDTIILDGNYSSGLTLGSRTLKSIDAIELIGGHDYSITLVDGNIAEGGGITFAALTTDPTDSITIDASAETDGSILVIDGQGDDVLLGGAMGDVFIMSGGQNFIDGAGGDDQFQYIGSNFTVAEAVDGGSGEDTLFLVGDYADGITLAAATMIEVEGLTVQDGFDYAVTFNDDALAAGETFTANAAGSSGLSADYFLDFDGSAELDGKFVLLGGEGDDVLTGGAKNDTITGGLGADLLAGGDGRNTFVYLSQFDSTGPGFDTIDGFNGDRDEFDVVAAVTGRDPNINSGTLNKGTFEADLTAEVGVGQLLANQCVLFKPDVGNLAGKTFLVVDQNGAAGYQAMGDLVIELTNATNLSGIVAGSFI